jgi:hypothetical protein
MQMVLAILFFDATNFEITITDNNLTISPNDLEWIGSEDVHIQITDVTSAGLYSTETVNFTVSEQSLPPIMSDVPGQTVFFDENFQTINLEEYLISQGNDEILWDYKLISEVNIENSPTWKIDPASFNFQMNIIARVLSRNSKIDSGNHLLGAFNNNNELRGVCSPLNVAGEYLFFLTVYSNNWNDTITFNFFDDSYNETLPILENKVFASNSVLGSSANPVELKAGRLVLDIDNQSNVTIHRVDSLWTGKEDLEFYAIENTSERLGDTTLTFVQVKNDLLPVELSNFSCEVYNENVVLNWRTETELNNYGFDVERETVISTERRNLEEPKGTSHSFSASWETLGFVQGHGNSNSRKIYSFLDSRPISGINRYRLKQIDTDGVFEYSEIVEVKTDIPTSFKLSQNFPNPFNPTTEINYSIPNNGINSSISSTNVALKIYDILGCEVATLVDKMQTPGNYSVTFNANQLSSGIYFYSIRTNVNVAIKKMILLR